MGMARVMNMRNYFEFEPTVGRVNGLYELFSCVGGFLGALQQEKFRVAGGYVYQDLHDEWAEDGWCCDDLGELALGGMICIRLGFIERIYPDVPGIDPEMIGIYAVTTEGSAWLEHYNATYAERRAKWLADLDAAAHTEADGAEQADQEAKR